MSGESSGRVKGLLRGLTSDDVVLQGSASSESSGRVEGPLGGLALGDVALWGSASSFAVP